MLKSEKNLIIWTMFGMLKTILKLLDNAKIFFITISVIQIYQLQKLPDNIEKAAKIL